MTERVGWMDRIAFTQAPACPKCRGLRHRREWHPAGDVANLPSSMVFGVVDEHLHLTCETCGFEQIMATADEAP